MKSTVVPTKANDLISLDSEWPVHSLQRAVNRIFQDFFSGSQPFAYPSIFSEEISKFSPKVDLSETDKDYVVRAEIPGMKLSDIEVSVNRDMLTIKGEKKQEKEENVKGRYRMERTYGSFYRTITLPGEIESDKAEAKIKDGLLTISLPKTKATQETVKKLAVKEA